MKSVHEGDTLVVWKLDRLARSARQLIDTVDALRERGAAFRSLTEARHDDPRGRLVFHIFGGGRGYARRSEPSGRHDRARALHAEVRDPLGPAARWRPLQLCWDPCIVGRAPSATRLVCLTRLLRGVKAIKFAGRAAGKGRPACRPETEARACLWAFLIRAGRGRSYH